MVLEVLVERVLVLQNIQVQLGMVRGLEAIVQGLEEFVLGLDHLEAIVLGLEEVVLGLDQLEAKWSVAATSSHFQFSESMA